jgi:hypothetical protein
LAANLCQHVDQTVGAEFLFQHVNPHEFLQLHTKPSDLVDLHMRKTLRTLRSLKGTAAQLKEDLAPDK